MNWLDLLAVQGTLKSLQHHSSKAPILCHSAFFMVRLSRPYMATEKTTALTRGTFEQTLHSSAQNSPPEPRAKELKTREAIGPPSSLSLPVPSAPPRDAKGQRQAACVIAARRLSRGPRASHG